MSVEEMSARVRQAADGFQWAEGRQRDIAAEAIANYDYTAAATACLRAAVYHGRVVVLLEAIDE